MTDLNWDTFGWPAQATRVKRTKPRRLSLKDKQSHSAKALNRARRRAAA